MPDDVRLIDVHIPEVLAEALGGQGPALDRRVTASVARDAYEEGRLTADALRSTLGSTVSGRGLEPEAAEALIREIEEFRQRVGPAFKGVNFKELIDEDRKH